MKLYKKLARVFDAWQNCIKGNNHEWKIRHQDTITALVEEFMPSGSGFDAGTQFDFYASCPGRLVFKTAFHHMDENGFYDGWTEHKVTVKPDLSVDFSLSVSGRNKNAIKEYITEIFAQALDKEEA